MVGLVVVSHSRPLARAAVALAAEMLHDSHPPIEMAAGLDESTLGTDAVAISEAVTRADRGDGVVVVMDLGSAILSTELALEMLDDDARARVILCPGPLVEGLVAATVSAATGATREEVAAEASAALEPKLAHLGPAPSTEDTTPSGPTRNATVTITNRHGLHARPAALLVTAARRFEATVDVRNRTTGSAWQPAASLTRVATLGVLPGHEIEVRASGPQANEAVGAIVDLAARGFDEDANQVEVVTGRPMAGPAQAASPGVGIGPAWHPRPLPDVPETPGSAADNPEEEWRRVEGAVRAARDDIETIRAEAERAGESTAGIFGAHLLMLDDLLAGVRSRIDRGEPAIQAFRDVAEHVATEFEALEDPYLKARAADVRAVGEQVVRHLLGEAGAAANRLDGEGILVVDELTPADVVGLDPHKVTGVLQAGGSPTAHAAILARARGIPMVVGAGPGVLDVRPGTTIALDGSTGEFVVAPEEEARDDFRVRAESIAAQRVRATVRANEPAITRDGITIAVAANVGSIEDARTAAAHGADLAGLVRTEFLFLNRDEAPSVDEQVATYRQIAEAIGGRRITLRTLDVGGDKPLRYAPSKPEENPFLGVRGIRHSLAHPALLRDQLDAFVRVARETPVSVMFPMVTSLDELIAARRILDDLRPPETLSVGIMVEVPAAALKIASFRGHVDFLSVGTNDLTQYTLAAERGNPGVPADGLDPAVLRLVDHVCRESGVPVAVCGELAADATAVPILIALGVREMSVNPPAVPLVKEAVRAGGGESAAWMLTLPDAGAIRRAVIERREEGRRARPGR